MSVLKQCHGRTLAENVLSDTVYRFSSESKSMMSNQLELHSAVLHIFNLLCQSIVY
jgi:hypothetical protein